MIIHCHNFSFPYRMVSYLQSRFIKVFINIIIVIDKNMKYENVAQFLHTCANLLMLTLLLTVSVFHSSG
jgi:succinate dehydrogenase hydrophobic anchor subunit